MPLSNSILHGCKRIGLSLLAVTLVGCGGAGDKNHSVAKAPVPASATTPVSQSRTVTKGSKDSFAARAEAICRRLTAEFHAKPPKSSSIAEIARVSPGRAVLERDAVAELKRLHAPASARSGWIEILRYRATLADELASVGVAAHRHDVDAVDKLARTKLTVHKLLRAAATRIELSGCGEIS
jgi:hypothetical protein